MSDIKRRSSYGLLVVLSLLVIHDASHAAPAPDWIPAPRSEALPGIDSDGSATWFSPSFSKKRGTFRAMFESIMDSRKSVSGEFLVGQFRYTYRKAMTEGNSQFAYDELIELVMLDCANSMSATLDSTYKLKGKVVGEKRVSDDDLLMMQMSGPTTVGDLCDFAHAQGAL